MTQIIDVTKPVYASVKDTAARTGLSTYYLRQRIAEGSAPVIKAGSKYLINVPRLLEQLEHESAGV